ncbi:MAG TPA: hypothetical protein VII50_06130 [Acidothermaceae bacterium]
MTTFPASGGKPPLLGQVALPPLGGGLVVVWQLLFDIAAAVPIGRWQLVGGQMVLLHGLCAGRQPLRATHDIDVLADLLTASDGLRVVVAAIEGLGFEPVEDSSGHIYRFARSRDNAAVDVLAPDHTPPTWRLVTARGKETIRVDGGRQAMQRPALIGVTMADATAEIPVPDLLGALVLKAAAWMVDSRDRERHSGDAAFLVSLIGDPRQERSRFTGSDRKRLNKLSSVLGDPAAPEWAALGDRGPDAFTSWTLLLS